MTPLASVAMLEKLALLKIARCSAPVFKSVSAWRMSTSTSAPRTVPVGRGHTQGLTGEASLAKKLTRSQRGDNRFLALVGCHGELHLALHDEEQGIRGLPLHENSVIGPALEHGFPSGDSRQQRSPIDS